MGRRSSLKKKDRSREKQEKMEKALERKTVVLPEGPMTVGQISELLDEKPASVIKFLMTDMGVMASISQSLDPTTCVAVVEGLGRIIGTDDDDDDYDDFEEDEDAVISTGFAMDEDDEEDLLPRPPVVTIMGHVDHGKTSLLDAIRNTKVTATEAGGITQHIAAYQIEHEGSSITFIDTPGHAAFTDMRERGANMTDIVILVVAADDGVKQQTTDSIVCAKQAGVPLIIAVNKCDLETADPTRVKSDLAAYDILTEDLGGEVLCSEISAKTGENLDDLLTKIMLQCELQDLKANPNRDAQGIVVEARMEKGLGAVATTLIQRGTIKVGDAFVAGEASGKVRALIADDGKTRLKEAGPSTPVTVVGLNGIPTAGDLLVVAEDETLARELANARQRIARERESSQYQSGLTQSVLASFSGDNKERRDMCVVVKADVQGSAEALSRSLSELTLENDEAIVGVKVLVAEAGDVTKTDVAIASVTPDTTIIAFNIAATQAAMDDARTMDIPIEYYSVVYDAIDSVECRMQEVLSPTPEGEYVGAAVVQEVFNIGGTGNIAGSRCTDGSIRKGSNVRVMRGDKILTESKVRTLRNFKAEVDAINEGDECGIGLLDFEDFQPGDVIESYVVAKK
jgi:translation initiation factor IF-2